MANVYEYDIEPVAMDALYAMSMQNIFTGQNAPANLPWSGVPLQGIPKFGPCVQVKVYRRSLGVLHLKKAPDSRLPVIRAYLRLFYQHADLPKQ